MKTRKTKPTKFLHRHTAVALATVYDWPKEFTQQLKNLYKNIFASPE